MLGLILWCLGAFFTAEIIVQSIHRFLKYPSVITARNGMKGMLHTVCIWWAYNGSYLITSEITFPKILLCSNSLHSRAKLNELYPDLTDKDVWKLYGQATSKRTREFWNKLVISNVRTVFSAVVTLMISMVTFS